MALHLHLGRWWPIVCPSSGSFLTDQKNVFLYHYILCCRLNQYSVVHQVYHLYTVLWVGSTGANLVLSLWLHIDLYLYATYSAAGPCIFNYYGRLLLIVVIINIISVCAVVLNNICIIETHCLPVDTYFSLIYTSLLVAICCHQHHGLIWIFYSINMELLATNYSSNEISISYLLPNIGFRYGTKLTRRFLLYMPARRRCKNNTIAPIHNINRFSLIFTFWHIFWVMIILIIGWHDMHYQTNLITTQDCQICELHYFLQHLLHSRHLQTLIQVSINEE